MNDIIQYSIIPAEVFADDIKIAFGEYMDNGRLYCLYAKQAWDILLEAFCGRDTLVFEEELKGDNRSAYLSQPACR